MNVLLTGASGFAGHHLTDYFVAIGGYTLHGTHYGDPAQLDDAFVGKMQSITDLDITDLEAVTACVKMVQPDLIYHFAAQAFVPAAFKNPWLTFEINARGTMNILEAVRQLEMIDTRVLVTSSSAVYGRIQPEDLPIKETQPLNPADPYGASKVAQDMIARQYFNTYGLKVIRARPFNHTGPGQNPDFVVPNFATQIAEIETGSKPPILNVGNLAAERDLSDVRDVVRAYHLMLTQGEPGQAYNVAQGQAFSIQRVVDQLINYAKVDIDVQVDSARLRPIDVPNITGDFSKLHALTGWQPQIPFETTILDVLNNCRQRMQSVEE